jgi:hypothetical protein
MPLVTDRLKPPIDDGQGYQIRHRDLRFLQIAEHAVAEWRARRLPLGMSLAGYEALQRGIERALRRDGLQPTECDVRLKGSAAEFFSGWHKRMPRTKDEVVDLFRELRGRVPDSWEIADVMHRLEQDWISDNDFPSRRPFDSIYRLGIAREPSDIDIQISSDVMVNRCQEILSDLGQVITEVRINHPVYTFVRRDLVEHAFPELYLFSLRMTDRLLRNVSVVVFPAAGPPDVSNRHGELSSHLRSTDWKVSMTAAAVGTKTRRAEVPT